jgi:hemoglobin
MGMPELDIYSMIGAEGFTRLVAAFYRQVPQDDLLGPIYPASDLPGAEQRLRDFLIGRFGGPQTYVEQRGHPRLRARHSPFSINQTIRDRWMRLMENALGEASLPSNSHGFSDAGDEWHRRDYRYSKGISDCSHRRANDV